MAPLVNEATARPGGRTPRWGIADIRDNVLQNIDVPVEHLERTSAALAHIDRHARDHVNHGGHNARRTSSHSTSHRHSVPHRHPHPAPPPPPKARVDEDAQAATLCINPAKASDVTVHLSLDLHEDLEDTLEELARLRRLGHFKQALSLAEREVKPFLHNRYVLVQYAQLLMEARRYKDIARLSIDYPPTVGDSPSSVTFNWTMICQLVEATTELDVGKSTTRPNYAGYAGYDDAGWLDSTWLEIIILSIRLSPAARRPTLGWENVYKTLQQDGRIWEAHDLIEAVLQEIEAETFLAQLFSLDHDSYRQHGDDVVRQHLVLLLQDWNAVTTGPQGESRLLALMGMFTNLVMSFSEVLSSVHWGPVALTMAREVAGQLVTLHGVHTIRTRPFLRFLAVEAMMTSLGGPDGVLYGVSYEYGQCGRVVYHEGIRFPDYVLPHYAPDGTETPIWAPRRNKDVVQVLRTVFEAAEQLGDVGLQIGCLTQLIVYGEDNVSHLLDELDRLNMEAGDFVNQRHCLLFGYFLARTREDKKVLRGRILESGPYIFLGSDNETRNRILKALEDQGWDQAQSLSGERPVRRLRPTDFDTNDESPDNDSDNEDHWYDTHPPPSHGRPSEYSQRHPPPPPPHPMHVETSFDMKRQQQPVRVHHPANTAQSTRSRTDSSGPDGNSSSHGAGPLVIYNQPRSDSRHPTSTHEDDYYLHERLEPYEDRVRTVNFEEPEGVSRSSPTDGPVMVVRRSAPAGRSSSLKTTGNPEATAGKLPHHDRGAQRYEEVEDPAEDEVRRGGRRELSQRKEVRRQEEARRDEASRDDAWRKEVRLRALREQARRMDAERHETPSTGQVPPPTEDHVGTVLETIEEEESEAHGDVDIAYGRHGRDDLVEDYTASFSGRGAASIPTGADVASRRTTVTEDVDD